MRKLCSFALAFLSAAPAWAGYSKLADARSRISFPPYTVEQKKLVLGQAKLILNEMYVHRDLKIQAYGESVNPTPALLEIEKIIPTITASTFHKKLSETFLKQRDLHTLYYLPRPYACYESFLPFSFKRVLAGQGRSVFAVSNVATDTDILALLPKPLTVKIGDKLVSYNGLTAAQAVERAATRSVGANPDAANRRALDDLRFREHDLDFVPEENSVKLVFQNAQGQNFTEEIPWIVFANEKCLKDINPRIPKSPSSASAAGHGQEPTLYWQINDTVHGQFGFIQLTSFTPTELSVEEVVTTIRKLLLNELKDTDGLIFDTRSNPGGQLPLAERLIQLFTPSKVTPSQFIMKNTEANYYYMRSSDALNPFTQALVLARELGTAYTEGRGLDSFDALNDLGQVYFKPVAIFVNSKCYSACDIFAAQAQDHGSATIFGEESATGGGGANTYSLNQIMEELPESNTNPFKNLPYHQNIQFAFRQAVRVGLNSGKLIENVGVQVDRMARAQMSDLFNATNDQLMTIQAFLGSETTKYNSTMFFENEERHDFKLNQVPSFQASWENTPTFNFRENGKLLETRQVTMSDSAVLNLPGGIETSKIRDGRMEILGSQDDKTVWRKILNYRFVPDWTPLMAGRTNMIDKFALYSTNTAPGEGWNLSQSSLILGNGMAYKNDVHAEASIFVSLPAEVASLEFDALTNTEKDLDYFKIIAVSDGKEVLLLEKQSGNLPLKKHRLDLSQFRGKQVEIRFIFKSDPGQTDAGVALKNIWIEA